MTTQSAEASAFARRIERTERVISVVRNLADQQDGPVRNHRVWKKMLYRLIRLLNRLAREAAAAEAEAKPKPIPAPVKPAPLVRTESADPVAKTPVEEAPVVAAESKPPKPAPPAEPPAPVAQSAPKPAPEPAVETPEPAPPQTDRSDPTRAEFAQFGTLENAGRVISTNAWSSHTYHIGTKTIDYNTTQMMTAYNDIDADLNRDLDRAGDVQDRERVRATGVSDRWASDKTEEDWERGEG